MVRSLSNANYIQPNKKPLLSIFDWASDGIDWNSTRVLDFGCNVGNFYLDSAGRIPPQSHVGLDIQAPSIEIARKRYPATEWVWQDEQHWTYNPEGKRDQELAIQGKVDVVVAYSVFSHCPYRMLLDPLSRVKRVLNPEGPLPVPLWRAGRDSSSLAAYLLGVSARDTLSQAC